MTETKKSTSKTSSAPKATKPLDVVFGEFSRSVVSLGALDITARSILSNGIDASGKQLTKAQHAALLKKIAGKFVQFNKTVDELVESITK